MIPPGPTPAPLDSIERQLKQHLASGGATLLPHGVSSTRRRCGQSSEDCWCSLATPDKEKAEPCGPAIPSPYRLIFEKTFVRSLMGRFARLLKKGPWHRWGLHQGWGRLSSRAFGLVSRRPTSWAATPIKYSSSRILVAVEYRFKELHRTITASFIYCFVSGQH